MLPTHEINWWIDHTGSTHTNPVPSDGSSSQLAIGKLFPDTNTGIITHLNNRPANIALVSQELLDVLHKRFPGTHWWIKDTAPESVPATQSAS